MTQENGKSSPSNHPAHGHPLKVKKWQLIVLGIICPIVLVGSIVGGLLVNKPEGLSDFFSPAA